MRQISLVILSLLGLVMCLHSCSSEAPYNPYQDVVYEEDIFAEDTANPNSFAYIHKNILLARCAMPACHDGAFEPDFRSPQSAYATLVYQANIKNHPQKEFNFRVLPNDTAKSWLWERITTDNDTIGQMPLYADPLSASHLQSISNWIMNGAPNLYGELPSVPNKAAKVEFFVAVSQDFQTNYSDDRINDISYNPFYAPKDTTMLIVPLVEDDSTALADLQINELLVSDKKDDFSNATVIPAQFFDFGQNGQFWIASINTGHFNTGQVYYMRYQLSDGEQSLPTLFPEDESLDPYKTFWSFYIEP